MADGESKDQLTLSEPASFEIEQPPDIVDPLDQWKKWKKAKKRKSDALSPLPEERNPGIIFLLSSARSGSTLLRVMLAGHPQLFAPPELHLLPFYSMGAVKKIFRRTVLREGLQRTFMELKSLSADESMAEIEALIKQDMPVQKVYALLQELAAPRTLVDKSPSYSSDMDTLARAEEIFDKPKYIYLIRHPYAAIESFVRNELFKNLVPDLRLYGEQLWATGNSNALKFFRKIDADRHHLVRYEELAGAPEKVMRGLCDFLKLSFDEAVLKPYEGNRMRDGVDSNALSVGDPNFLKHDKIDPSFGEAWKKIKLDRPLGEFAQRVAMALQYELPAEAASVAVGSSVAA